MLKNHVRPASARLFEVSVSHSSGVQPRSSELAVGKVDGLELQEQNSVFLRETFFGEFLFLIWIVGFFLGWTNPKD